MGDLTIQEFTVKQRNFFKKYLECGDATEAAMYAYNCTTRNSASTIGWKLLRQVDLNYLMELHGITDKKLLDKVDEGLEAKRVISAIKTEKQATAADSDFIEVPDYSVRHKYLDTALKLKKRLGDTIQIGGDNANIQFNIIAGGYIPKQRSANEASMGSNNGTIPIQDADMA